MHSKNQTSIVLPTECTYEVLKLLQNDRNSLFNCCLVNRSWFKLSSAILYSNPCEFFKTQPVNTINTTRATQFLRILYACIDSETQLSFELKKLLNVGFLGQLTTDYLGLVKGINLDSFDYLVHYLLPGDSTHTASIRLHFMFELRVLWKMYRERYASSNLKVLSWNSCFPVEDLIDISSSYNALESISLDWSKDDCALQSEHLEAIFQVTPKLSNLHIRVRFSKGDFTPILERFLQRIPPNTMCSIILEGIPLNIEALLASLCHNHRQSLNRLEFVGYNFQSISLDVLTRFPKLQCVSLASSRGINDSKLQQICKCARLQDIDISKTDVTLSGLSSLVKCVGSKLRYLRLNQLSMNIPKGLEVISEHCPELTCLELRRTVYDCHLVPQLILCCPKLELLYLGDEVGNLPSSIDAMVKSIFRSGNKLKFLDLGYCHLTFSVLPLMMLKTKLNIVGLVRCVGVELENLPSKNTSHTRLSGITADIYYDNSKGLELPVAVFPPTFFTKPYRVQFQ